MSESYVRNRLEDVMCRSKLARDCEGVFELNQTVCFGAATTDKISTVLSGSTAARFTT